MKSFFFFNSIKNKIEEFNPINPSKVTVYSCGPTVYDKAHIGNFRSYIFTDILIRSLRLGGYKVENAMNITDLDDKTIQRVLQKKENPDLNDLKEYTQKYIDIFFEDIETLNISKAKYYPKASDNIGSMIILVQRLLKKKVAYQEDGSVYYAIDKKKDYGKLSGLDLSQVRTGLRYNTDEYSKKDIRDFVLWKKQKPEEKIFWESPYGKGRPGWHLECSAMIHNIFQDKLDIHTGGLDLIFPHHENEIAQSEAAFDHGPANYWLHCEHLLVEGHKMSKSMNNFYTLKDLFQEGYHAMAIRYLLLSVPYRQKLNFTFEALKQSSQVVKRIWSCYERLLNFKAKNKNEPIRGLERKLVTLRDEFLTCLREDLNTAKALAVLHEFLHFVNSIVDNKDHLDKWSKENLLNTFGFFDSVLQILSHYEELSIQDTIPNEIILLYHERNKARENENYQKADELRLKILEAGYEILDMQGGSKIRKKLINQ